MNPTPDGSVTQYGVQTPYSSTVLTVTTDRAVAEHALEWIQDGRIVTRTVAVSGWRYDSEEHQEGDLEQTG